MCIDDIGRWRSHRQAVAVDYRDGKISAYRYVAPINCQDATLSTRETANSEGSKTDAQISTAIVERLADRLGQSRYELWFSGKGAVEFSQGQLTIQSESNFSLNLLQNKFGKDIRGIVGAVCGPNVEVEFVIRSPKPTKLPSSRRPLSNQPTFLDAGDAAEETPVALAVASKPTGSSLRSSVVRDDFVREERPVVDSVSGAIDAGISDPANQGAPVDSIPSVAATTEVSPESPAAAGVASGVIKERRVENQSVPERSGSSSSGRNLQSFWFGSNNRIARASVEQVTETPGQYSPLLIYGPSGSGKTHLLEAITLYYRRRLRKKRCVFLSAEQFTTMFVGSLRDNRGLPMFRQKVRDLDLFAVDDIQFLAGKAATLNEFQFTLDTLIRQGKQVVVSADRSPMDLDVLGGDLLNRLAGGLSCPLRHPDHEGRMFIVRRMCSDRNFDLPEDVIAMVAGQITRDVRRLSGAVNRLRAVAMSTQQKDITVDFATEALRDLLAMSTVGTSMANIENAVCEMSGVKPSELRSSSRRKTISSARMLAMFLAREHTNSALSEIGDYFGNRSHSTVIAAQKKMAALVEAGADLKFSSSSYPVREAIEQIRSKLRLG